MRFYVTRTSLHSDQKPCDEAFSTIVDNSKRWMIEVDSLSELIDLKTKYGDLIIQENIVGNDSLLEIEIYDDYREWY